MPLLRAAVCGIALLAYPAQAQRKKPERSELAPAPPPVVAQSLSVRRGESIVVPLGIDGVRGEQLEFLIRTHPKRGKLSEVRSTGVNSATVTYTSLADAEPGEESFTYAVRSNEGVSAPGAVGVRVTMLLALPPRLGAPVSVKFPAVFVGERGTATLEITNQGGGICEGEVKVAAPWSVDGPARYKLTGGQRESIKLVFKPTKAGEAEGQAELGPTPSRVVPLIATAQAALSFSPGKLALLPERGSQTRTAKLTLHNHSAEPRKVTLAGGERLLTDGSADVPAKGKTEIAVFAEAAEVRAFRETLRLESAGWSATVPIEIAPLPAVVKFAGKGAQFGPAIAGQRVQGIAVLENSGGADATVKLSVGAPFDLAAKAVTVPALGRADVRLFASLPPGRHTAPLAAEWSDGVEKLTVSVDAAEAPKAASQPQKKSPRSDPSGEKRAQAGGGDSQFAADYVNARGYFARDIQPTGAVLEWPASLGPAVDLHAELRLLALTPDGTKTDWLPVNAKFTAGGDPLRADITKLKPGELQTIRVRSGDETLFTVQFSTPPKQPFLVITWRGLGLTLLAASLVGVGWWKWKTRSRSGW